MVGPGQIVDNIYAQELGNLGHLHSDTIDVDWDMYSTSYPAVSDWLLHLADIKGKVVVLNVTRLSPLSSDRQIFRC